jgi:hypothetical protein
MRTSPLLLEEKKDHTCSKIIIGELLNSKIVMSVGGKNIHYPCCSKIIRGEYVFFQ